MGDEGRFEGLNAVLEAEEGLVLQFLGYGSIPHALAALVVQMSINVPETIILETSMSFSVLALSRQTPRWETC